MYNLHLVGCGSLGSALTIEIIKRAKALEFPLEIHLYDFDKVEERNIFAQAFSPSDIGSNKVDAVSNMVKSYNTSVTPHCQKITQDDIGMKLDNLSIIIDCVDNIPTRQLLWNIGVSNGVPVLHLGMDVKGSGYISWNYMKDGEVVDTFPYSPTSNKTIKEGEVKTLPPCELNSMRPLIFNTVMAGLNALFIFLGMDVNKLFEELFEGEQFKGTMTTWYSDILCVKPIKDLVQIVEWGAL